MSETNDCDPMQTPSVASLKGRIAVVVTNDILVETAQVPCYMHGICQEY